MTDRFAEKVFTTTPSNMTDNELAAELVDNKQRMTSLGERIRREGMTFVLSVEASQLMGRSSKLLAERKERRRGQR